MNGELLRAVQAQRPAAQATFDMDATLVETHKREALYCYKQFKAYQPLNTWWAEQGLIVHSEFRDGNVPAGHEQLRVLEEAARLLPDCVTAERMIVRLLPPDLQILALPAFAPLPPALKKTRALPDPR